MPKVNYSSIKYIFFGHHVDAKNIRQIKSIRTEILASLPRIIQCLLNKGREKAWKEINTHYVLTRKQILC